MQGIYLILFFKSALVGLSIAAPVGPIGLLCMQRTLDHGARIGLATGLGAALADAVYGAIGASGMSVLMAAMTGARAWLGVAGAMLLLWMALGTWRSAQPGQAAAVAVAGPHVGKAFGGTFLLTLSNPMTILSFIAVFAALAGSTQAVSPAWIVSGVFAGSAAWWLLLVAIVARVRHRIAARHLLFVRRASALVLAGFAFAQLASLLR